MPETSIQTPPGFNELPKAEQVRYLQALWDQISANPDEVPVPESHLQLAEERLRRYREDPSTAKPAFDVIDRLARKSEWNDMQSKPRLRLRQMPKLHSTGNEGEEPELGFEFLEELRANYQRILDHPFGYQELRSGIRRVLTRRFPYAIYFQSKEKRL
jgi:hypothetical protein